MTTITSSGPSIACSRCSYDLRGTVIGGVCPECGLPVNSSVHGVRVEGKFLVIRDDTVLPNRCVKTNEEVDAKPVKKTLYWSHPALALLILVNFLVFLIVALIVRKKCQVTYYLSEDQKSRRRIKIASASFISLLALVVGIVLAMDDQWIGLIVGLIVCLFAIICAAVFASTMRIAKVKGREFWISGATPVFLQSLSDHDLPAATYRP
jgi:hypothetical protein